LSEECHLKILKKNNISIILIKKERRKSAQRIKSRIE